ncbi:MAG: tRNA epoxyqueuosine(34) reductase QueG [Rikenellaceae bacterium]
MLISSYTINKCAKNVGFDLCGVIKSAEVMEYDDFFMEWIRSFKNAGLDWADRNHDLRRNPASLHPSTKSIVVLGLAYHKKHYSHEVSMLANGIDYHYVVKQKLQMLKGELEKECGVVLDAKTCVDSAPITEKYWAVRAGLGWIGNNSLVVNKDYGSFFVLGELLIDCEVDSYSVKDEFNGCVGCNRCEKKCPTSALEGKVVDSRRCLAYLTIEQRHEFNETQLGYIRSGVRESYFGCDMCQDVCPWNVKALHNLEDSFFVTKEELFRVVEFRFDADSYEGISNSEFKRRYGSTALFRTGKKKILMNIKAIN